MENKTSKASTKHEIQYAPILWACLVFVICAAICFAVAGKAKSYIQTGQLTPPPPASATFPIFYFLASVVILGVILFFIPVSKLKMIFRILFIILYAWGIFVLGYLFIYTSTPAVIGLAIVAVIISVVWFLVPNVWLHNVLMILSLAGVGVVFGMVLKPWTVLIVLGVISVYDVLAVSLGYMMWMAKKISESDTLPTFVLPKQAKSWGMKLGGGRFKQLMETSSGEREFSILGGGDIGFPMIMSMSVFFDYGLMQALVVTAFSLLGMIAAFLIQQTILKGKAMPALPPISAGALIGFLLIRFVI
jgi:presenilin-like A22 family membrane protease